MLHVDRQLQRPRSVSPVLCLFRPRNTVFWAVFLNLNLGCFLVIIVLFLYWKKLFSSENSWFNEMFDFHLCFFAFALRQNRLWYRASVKEKHFCHTSQEQTFQKTNDFPCLRAEGLTCISLTVRSTWTCYRWGYLPPCCLVVRGQDWEGDRKPGPNWPDAIRTLEPHD